MIGAIFFLCIGLIPLTIGLVLFFKGLKTKTWKPIVGRIQKVDLARRYDSGSDNNGMSYQCLVEYEYDSLKGNSILNGNKIAIGYMPSNNEKGHKAIQQKLQSSKQVKIWVNPKNESQSVICRGTNQYPFFVMTFGIMIILFALGMMSLADGKKSSTSGKKYKVEVIERKNTN